jgi:mono/diheme cytochrome c family protein
VRLVVVPLCLFFGVSAAVFALAKLTLAEPGVPRAAAGRVALGDPYRGQVVYSQACAGCHGENGEGGVGPRLAGATITLAAAKAQIESPLGTMPPNLVEGRKLDDVLAYLSQLFEETP